ncbi:MAG: hypothetical protein Q9172_007716 [Xanthocarpia lactea]
MDVEPLTAAILIISDTAFRDPPTDKAGPTLTDVFNQDGGSQWRVSDTQIVPDDVVAIQRRVTGWCDGEHNPNLIITTGGTGFTLKDNTPEAIGPLLHKHATGLVHGMLAASINITPFAVMSRPVAGVRNKTIIITLPGSPKGAKENLQAILKQLPHACKQAAGEDSRAAHKGGVKALEEQAGVGSVSMAQHHHEHHRHSHHHSGCHGHATPKAHTNVHDRPVSNDPNEGPAQRHRESPYPMISVDEALKLILDHTPSPKIIQVPVDGNLVGCVLAEDVQAEEPVPAFRASIVDGYAIILTKETTTIKGVYPVVSVSHARPGDVPSLQNGQVARITTGAPLPPGATSVVMLEDTIIKTKTENGQEEIEIEILTNDIIPGENVREVGSDVKAGETILRKGEMITTVGGEFGLLASVGKREISIYQKPIVGVLSTGDEIVPHDRPGPLRLGEVRDTNRPTLIAAVRGWGFSVIDLGIASDK